VAIAFAPLLADVAVAAGVIAGVAGAVVVALPESSGFGTSIVPLTFFFC
jgi:hypothetical protein